MNFEPVNAYIEDLYAADTRLRREAFIRASELEDFIPVVDDDVARFLSTVLRIARPKRVLEIGTSIGFSASSIAALLREYGGRLTTLEYDARVAEQAQRNFTRLGLEDVIELVQGDARAVLPALEGPYDVIFQDADKRLYPELFSECLRLLRPGGLLIAEDALFPAIDLDEKWRDLIEPIRRFDRMVAACPELDSTLLPIGDGVMLAVKRGT